MLDCPCSLPSTASSHAMAHSDVSKCNRQLPPTCCAHVWAARGGHRRSRDAAVINGRRDHHRCGTRPHAHCFVVGADRNLQQQGFAWKKSIRGLAYTCQAERQGRFDHPIATQAGDQAHKRRGSRQWGAPSPTQPCHACAPQLLPRLGEVGDVYSEEAVHHRGALQALPAAGGADAHAPAVGAAHRRRHIGRIVRIKHRSGKGGVPGVPHPADDGWQGRLRVALGKHRCRLPHVRPSVACGALALPIARPGPPAGVLVRRAIFREDCTPAAWMYATQAGPEVGRREGATVQAACVLCAAAGGRAGHQRRQQESSRSCAHGWRAGLQDYGVPFRQAGHQAIPYPWVGHQHILVYVTGVFT